MMRAVSSGEASKMPMPAQPLSSAIGHTTASTPSARSEKFRRPCSQMRAGASGSEYRPARFSSTMEYTRVLLSMSRMYSSVITATCVALPVEEESVPVYRHRVIAPVAPFDPGKGIVLKEPEHPEPGYWTGCPAVLQRIGALQAPDPARLDIGTSRPALTPAATNTEGVKDPYILRPGPVVYLSASFAAARSFTAADRRAAHRTADIYNTGLTAHPAFTMAQAARGRSATSCGSTTR
jgi:hypothetical protein